MATAFTFGNQRCKGRAYSNFMLAGSGPKRLFSGLKGFIQMAVIEQKTVSAEETGMRLDRWFKLHYPGLSFGVLQKLMRTGQVRIDGARVKTDARVEPGQTVRIPPLKLEGDDQRPLTVATMRDRTDFDALRAMILHEDEKIGRAHV